MADLDIAAARQTGEQQCGRRGPQQGGPPQDQTMSKTPSAVFAHQGGGRLAGEAQVPPCARASAPATPDQHGPEAHSPQNAAQVAHGLPGGPAASAPAAGGLRSMPFHNLMPPMQGPQYLAARAAFDARFDARVARVPMQGTRMADVQVHGPRPVAQQMIPTPAIPADPQARDPRHANGSSGEDTSPDGPALKASASAADFLMGSAAAPGMDSFMDGEEEDAQQPPLLPPDLGMRQAPPTALWMSGADGELVSQSAAHSATLCATESAWTAVGNGGAVAPMHTAPAEPGRQHGYAWHHQGWQGSPPPGMAATPPGMHVSLQALLQQQHVPRDEIGRLLMAEDGEGLLGGPELPTGACMGRMHDDQIPQQPGGAMIPMSPSAEGGGMPREGAE